MDPAFICSVLIDRKRSLSEKAISLLKRSIELDRNLGEAYSLLASLHADAGRVEEAEILHVKALQVSPRNADFINNYAVFLHSRGTLRVFSPLPRTHTLSLLFHPDSGFNRFLPLFVVRLSPSLVSSSTCLDL